MYSPFFYNQPHAFLKNHHTRQNKAIHSITKRMEQDQLYSKTVNEKLKQRNKKKTTAGNY